ncbi:MAG TPA: TetR/AcrR family transcriptional regulator [Acidimicrobiales bacterium]|nr:TetR/AcrR family transcriptional regulator [Acidimicrobiales bacterium]
MAGPTVTRHPPGTEGRPPVEASGGRRTRARRGEGALLREDILAATEALLLDSGDTSSLSIRAIAAAVGVTPPSIYLHFADRNELIFAVCDRRWRDLEARLEVAAAGGADPVERVIRRGRAYVEFGLSHPEHYRVLLMSRDTDIPGRYADQALLTQRLGFDPLVADLRAAMEAGTLSPGDPDELCVVLFSAVHGLTSLLVTKAAFDWPPVERLVDRLVSTLLFGLAPRP